MHVYLPLLISPLPSDWLAAPVSDFSFVLQEADALLTGFPHLLEMIDQDLQRDALVKKEARQKDCQARHFNHPYLPGTGETDAAPVTKPKMLEGGRPRMSARTCYMFLVIRGYLGGVKSQEARDFMAESLSLHFFLAKAGITMPSPSTIIANTNKLCQATLDAILDAQIQGAKERGLDDFLDITADSTAIKANSCWPTDSGLIEALADRLCRGFKKLAEFGLPKLEDPQIPSILEDLHRLDFVIACAAGKKDAETIREEKYTELFDLAEVASQVFAEHLTPLQHLAEQKQYLPSKRQQLEKLLAAMHEDLEIMCRVISYATKRVLEKKKVPTAEKVTSISDPDASFIVKGQRDIELGYRPQVSKSASGLVVAVVVPEGNAADSEQLRNICSTTFQRTGIVPYSMSLDDGYTSLENRAWLKEEGVTVVSFSGAKGKRITPEEEWLDDAHGEARRMRSAVESVIFQLKRCFDFGLVFRRGIEKVREELTAKVVAFNFYRLQYLARL